MSKRKQTDDIDVPSSTTKKKAKLSESAPKSKPTSNNIPQTTTDWSIAEYIAEDVHCPLNVSHRLAEMFSTDQTVPFIARYRQHVTGGMEANDIRKALHAYETAKTIKSTAQKVLKQIGAEKLTPQLTSAINKAKSIMEIESYYAPFKPDAKRTLAGKARALGLDVPADHIIAGKHVDLQQYVIGGNKECDNVTKVSTGVQHILADAMAKHTDTHQLMRLMSTDTRSIQLQSKVSKSQKLTDEQKDKYKNYFDTTYQVDRLQPHQILAINRGEEQKALTVKIILPGAYIRNRYDGHIQRCFVQRADHQHQQLMLEAMNDCYTRLFEPQLIRLIRSNLTKSAEESSLSVFARNLQQRLLSPPQRDAPVLGMDPGYKHGCKMALLTPTSEIIYTGKIYLTSDKNQNQWSSNLEQEFSKVSDCLTQGEYKSLNIALGNGCGHKEAEMALSTAINRGAFGQNVHAQYCVVSETGASIYSVSELANKELPSLEPHYRSAVSIARRLLDPMAELVKIEPKHLGLGMYQHDLNEKQLDKELDSVVEECVSFVGVDLNTASAQLLLHVAGLSKSLADKIIKERTKLGRFTSRLQLSKIKGLGPKSFEQSAGFVRIASNSSKSDVTILDATSVHPESYDLAKRLIKLCGCQLSDVGTQKLRSASDRVTDPQLADIVNDKESVGLARTVLKALLQPINYDCRSAISAPVYRQSAKSVQELKVHQVLDGVISNVTSFGAFIDIGMGMDGLLHRSKLLRGLNLDTLHVGYCGIVGA